MKTELAGGRARYLGAFPRDVPVTGMPEVAVAGRSNVGKSRCLNTILGVRGAARVSRTPGRTQAIHLFQVSSGYVLADLPGYGFAKVPGQMQESWKALVERYLEDQRDLRLVLLLVDPRRGPLPQDRQLLDSLRAREIPVHVIATKADKLKKQQESRAVRELRQGHELEPSEITSFSALDRRGMGEIMARIQQATRDASR